jgi:hypothetical protein
MSERWKKWCVVCGVWCEVCKVRESNKTTLWQRGGAGLYGFAFFSWPLAVAAAAALGFGTATQPVR